MLRIIAFALIAVFSQISVASNLQVGSWNMMRLGSGDQKSYPALAEVASQFDIFAVQEVMNQEAIEKLKAALMAKTGEKWSSISSHEVGRHSYKEMYSFIWRDNAVEANDGGVVYLDRKDVFEREPFSASFVDKSTGKPFALSTVHIIYGKGEYVREPEIAELHNYWDWLQEIYPNTPVVLMGDFNMNPNEKSWAPLKEVAKPLITTGASTLSAKDGKFSNLYDNFWVSKSFGIAPNDYRIVQYPKMLGWSHEKSRKVVSDHAPIQLTLNTDNFKNPALVPKAKMQTLVSANYAPTGSMTDVRGNRNSMIYHLPGCKNYANISAKNVIHFNSEDGAKAAGYRIAANCN